MNQNVNINLCIVDHEESNCLKESDISIRIHISMSIPISIPIVVWLSRSSHNCGYMHSIHIQELFHIYILHCHQWPVFYSCAVRPDSGALTLIKFCTGLNCGCSLSPTSWNKMASLVVTIAPQCRNLCKHTIS